jgi:hypothetical protein
MSTIIVITAMPKSKLKPSIKYIIDGLFDLFILNIHTEE